MADVVFVCVCFFFYKVKTIFTDYMQEDGTVMPYELQINRLRKVSTIIVYILI